MLVSTTSSYRSSDLDRDGNDNLKPPPASGGQPRCASCFFPSGISQSTLARASAALWNLTRNSSLKTCRQRHHAYWGLSGPGSALCTAGGLIVAREAHRGEAACVPAGSRAFRLAFQFKLPDIRADSGPAGHCGGIYGRRRADRLSDSARAPLHWPPSGDIRNRPGDPGPTPSLMTLVAASPSLQRPLRARSCRHRHISLGP
jgi:hypothetical protein